MRGSDDGVGVAPFVVVDLRRRLHGEVRPCGEHGDGRWGFEEKKGTRSLGS